MYSFVGFSEMTPAIIYNIYVYTAKQFGTDTYVLLSINCNNSGDPDCFI